ncbi:MAG: hypothetical protein IJC73_01575, partial [Lentisphaeria bacterium]|nr:hypothetical protein [Lentisphaeria bacterium]
SSDRGALRIFSYKACFIPKFAFLYFDRCQNYLRGINSFLFDDAGVLCPVNRNFVFIQPQKLRVGSFLRLFYFFAAQIPVKQCFLSVRFGGDMMAGTPVCSENFI